MPRCSGCSKNALPGEAPRSLIPARAQRKRQGGPACLAAYTASASPAGGRGGHTDAPVCTPGGPLQLPQLTFRTKQESASPGGQSWGSRCWGLALGASAGPCPRKHAGWTSWAARPAGAAGSEGPSSLRELAPLPLQTFTLFTNRWGFPPTQGGAPQLPLRPRSPSQGLWARGGAGWHQRLGAWGQAGTSRPELTEAQGLSHRKKVTADGCP